mmetsp:Transcript_44222/g.100712  ORF Transcript_44222/g.100712 Transcript_44222/m.100712 type:complete len:683 (-) Transcript_44222:804-2852(-)
MYLHLDDVQPVDLERDRLVIGLDVPRHERDLDLLALAGREVGGGSVHLEPRLVVVLHVERHVLGVLVGDAENCHLRLRLLLVQEARAEVHLGERKRKMRLPARGRHAESVLAAIHDLQVARVVRDERLRDWEERHLHVHPLALADGPALRLDGQQARLRGRPLELDRVLPCVRHRDALDAGLVDMHLPEVDRRECQRRYLHRTALFLHGNRHVVIEALALDVERQARGLLLHVQHRVEVVVFLDLGHERDRQGQLRLGAHSPLRRRDLHGRRVLVRAVGLAVERERERDVLPVDQLHNLGALVVKEERVEVAEGLVEEDAWLLDMPHQDERYRDVVVRDHQAPERLEQAVGIGGVFEDHLRLLAREHDPLAVHALERLGKVSDGRACPVLALPPELVTRIGRVHDIEPLRVPHPRPKALKLHNARRRIHRSPRRRRQRRRTPPPREPVRVGQLEVAARAGAFPAHHHQGRGLRRRRGVGILPFGGGGCAFFRLEHRVLLRLALVEVRDDSHNVPLVVLHLRRRELDRHLLARPGRHRAPLGGHCEGLVLPQVLGPVRKTHRPREMHRSLRRIHEREAVHPLAVHHRLREDQGGDAFEDFCGFARLVALGAACCAVPVPQIISLRENLAVNLIALHLPRVLLPLRRRIPDTHRLVGRLGARGDHLARLLLPARARARGCLQLR